MKNMLIALLILSFSTTAFAQSPWKPWAVAEAGLLKGSYGPSGDLRLQLGLQKNNWMFGAGAAYDGYRYETVPVYAQVRKMFGSKKIKPFVMVSGGVNFEIEEDNPPTGRMYIWAPPLISYIPGAYADLGAGLSFRTHRRFGYNLSFSYTRKTLTERSAYPMWNGSEFQSSNSDTKYMMQRYAVRIAFRY